MAPRKKVKFAEEGDVDLEGLAAEHQDLEKKFDEENMAHAVNKFAPKEQKEKKKRDKLRKDRGEQDILTEESCSVKTWKYVPKFSMEKDQWANKREQKAIKLKSKHEREKQNSISKFIPAEFSSDRCKVLEQEKATLSLLKARYVGINNTKALYA